MDPRAEPAPRRCASAADVRPGGRVGAGETGCRLEAHYAVGERFTWNTRPRDEAVDRQVSAYWAPLTWEAAPSRPGVVHGRAEPGGRRGSTATHDLHPRARPAQDSSSLHVTHSARRQARRADGDGTAELRRSHLSGGAPAQTHMGRPAGGRAWAQPARRCVGGLVRRGGCRWGRCVRAGVGGGGVSERVSVGRCVGAGVGGGGASEGVSIGEACGSGAARCRRHGEPEKRLARTGDGRRDALGGRPDAAGVARRGRTDHRGQARWGRHAGRFTWNTRRPVLTDWQARSAPRGRRGGDGLERWQLWWHRYRDWRRRRGDLGTDAAKWRPPDADRIRRRVERGQRSGGCGLRRGRARRRDGGLRRERAGREVVPRATWAREVLHKRVSRARRRGANRYRGLSRGVTARVLAAGGFTWNERWRRDGRQRRDRVPDAGRDAR